MLSKTNCTILKGKLQKLYGFSCHKCKSGCRKIISYLTWHSSSVADPGCLFRIPDLNFYIPDPGSKRFWIPDTDRHKKFEVSLAQTIFIISRKYDLGCSSQIRIQIFFPSRIQKSKKLQIRIHNNA